jgi:hypothetical protein
VYVTAGEVIGVVNFFVTAPPLHIVVSVMLFTVGTGLTFIVNVFGLPLHEVPPLGNAIFGVTVMVAT